MWSSCLCRVFLNFVFKKQRPLFLSPRGHTKKAEMGVHEGISATRKPPNAFPLLPRLAHQSRPTQRREQRQPSPPSIQPVHLAAPPAITLPLRARSAPPADSPRDHTGGGPSSDGRRPLAHSRPPRKTNDGGKPTTAAAARNSSGSASARLHVYRLQKAVSVISTGGCVARSGYGLCSRDGGAGVEGCSGRKVAGGAVAARPLIVVKVVRPESDARDRPATADDVTRPTLPPAIIAACSGSSWVGNRGVVHGHSLRGRRG